jgi:hypothetical protein
MGWVVNSKPHPIYSRQYPVLFVQKAGGFRTGLDGCGISRLHRDSIPEHSIPLRVAVPARLFRPTLVSQGLIIEFSRSHNPFGRTHLDEWSGRRRDLYLTTHNNCNRQKPIASGGIGTHYLTKRAAVDPSLRPRDHLEFNIILPKIPTTIVLSNYGWPS